MDQAINKTSGADVLILGENGRNDHRDITLLTEITSLLLTYHYRVL